MNIHPIRIENEHTYFYYQVKKFCNENGSYINMQISPQAFIYIYIYIYDLLDLPPSLSASAQLPCLHRRASCDFAVVAASHGDQEQGGDQYNEDQAHRTSGLKDRRTALERRLPPRCFDLATQPKRQRMAERHGAIDPVELH